MNEGCEAEPRVWRYHRWDSFTCAKMKAGIVVGCLLKVSAMASDDEGFALSVTSKLREFTALGYPAHVLNGVIGRAFARTKDERPYEQDSVRSGEEVSCKTLTQTNQKSKKTNKCIVSGYRPKAGVVDQGTTNLVCRRHEFGMGHLRDPAACYLDSTLSEYRRLRPRQKMFLFFLRFSSQDFPV